MEILVGVTAAQSAFLGYIFANPGTKSEVVEDERLVRIFNDAVGRMGIDSSRVSLMQNDVVPLALSKGTLFCGMNGQVIVNFNEMAKLDDEQVAAVCAHELSHLDNYDQVRLPLFWFVAQTVVGIALITIYSWPLLPAYGVAFLVAAIASLCIYFPRIEFQADERAAKVLNERELERYIDYHEDQLRIFIHNRNRRGVPFCEWLSISPEGNNRRDLLHPRRTSIVEMLKGELASRKVCHLPA